VERSSEFRLMLFGAISMQPMIARLNGLCTWAFSQLHWKSLIAKAGLKRVSICFAEFATENIQA
jgi:hypothetical protein